MPGGREVGEILDAGIKVYLRNARLLMGLAATVVIPLQVISGIVLLSIVTKSDQLPGAFNAASSSTSSTTADNGAALGAEVVLALAGVIASALVTAACVKAVSDLYLGQTTGYGRSLRFAARRMPGYLAMEVLYLLGLAAGFLLLIVPGIWLYGAWSVSAPALLIEGLSPFSALDRSRQLVKGRWFPTAGVLLATVVIVGLVSAALDALVGGGFVSGQPSVLAAVALLTLAGTIASIIATPFTATVWTILYYDLRLRREGYDADLLAEQLGHPAGSLPRSSSYKAPGSAAEDGVDRGGRRPGGFDPPVPGGG